MSTKQLMGLITILALCAATAWAGQPAAMARVSPSDPGGPLVRLAPDSATVAATPAGRTLASPAAAAPLDDANVSAELAEGKMPSGPRGDYYVSTTGNDTTGDGTEGNPWATIQYAISQVTDGDTIHVATGTYVETGQIVIDKNLTILGDPADKPVVKPAQDTGSSGDARGWWLVNAGKHLTLQYLVLDGDWPSRKVHQAVRANGTLTVDTCELRNVKYSTYIGIGVVLFANGTVSNCTFTDIERIGVIAFGTGVTNALIYANTYTGKGDGDWLDYGVELGGGAVATVANNTITACTGVASGIWGSAGILITTHYGAGTGGTVLGNKLTGNTEAIAVGYDEHDTSTVAAHFNDVSGCDWGIGSTAPAVDGEKNWWGTTDSATIATLVWGPVDYTPWLLTPAIRMAFGGNRLVDLQNNDGGWDWPLDDGDPNNPSPQNTIGPIGMGLAKAYRATGDPDMLAALQKVSAFLLAKTNTFSPSDGYLAAELDAVLGGSTHVAHLNTYFYGPLAAGTYDRNGAGTLYNTAQYVQLIRDARQSQGIPNLAAWDLGMGLVGAASCGVSGSELNIWIAGVEAEINELDGDLYYDVIGLAGALYGLAFVGEDFDPTAGEHEVASSLSDLADILASYQIGESGGFAWNKNYVIPYDYNETVQETGYAILALEEMGGYDAEVAAAANWLLGFQLQTGGWKNWEGGGENNEVTAEALWGIWTQSPRLTFEPDAECYMNGETVAVELWMRDIPVAIRGGQFFLAYDNSKLSFVSATAQSPFVELYEQYPAAGQIDYAVYIPEPGTITGDAKMAVLTFTALADLCSEPGLITWRAHDPPSRLSDAEGNALYPALIAMDVVDDEAPLVTPPNATELECSTDLPAAATTIAQFLALPGASASDNCTDPNDLLVGSVTGSLVGDECSGTIMRTYTITDQCGNAAQVDHVFNVSDDTVPVVSGLSVVGGNVDNNCEFTVTFSATVTDNCCVDDDDVTVNVTLLTPNATLGTPTINKTQVDAKTVSISGSVLVSDLTSCPATVQVTVDAYDCCDNPATQAVDTDDVHDVTAPDITCPDDIEVNADAGVCTAEVVLPAPAALSDNCDPAPTYTYWIGETQIYSPHTFPAGTTIVTIKAKDACNNESSCTFKVTVNAVNDVVVTLKLQPVVATPLTRCITFELWECGGPSSVTYETELTFTDGLASATIEVPCGNYTCITARDRLHTLRRTLVAPHFHIDGTQYVADFVTAGKDLIGGNLNDDKWIDILDFGVYSWKFNTNYTTGDTDCSTGYPHADISGNGVVFTEDFTFIQINFLKGHEANCCGMPGFDADEGPITEISVAELVSMGMPELAAGDLNGDGWLDVEDIIAFMQGARPKAPVVTPDQPAQTPQEVQPDASQLDQAAPGRFRL